MAEGGGATEDHVGEILGNPEYHNWFIVRVAMVKVTEALRDRILSDFQSFYEDFKQTELSTLPGCKASVDCLKDNFDGIRCWSCAVRVNMITGKMKKSLNNDQLKRCSLTKNSPENHFELLAIFLRITNFKGTPSFTTMLNDLSFLCDLLSVCRFYVDDFDGETKMSNMKSLRNRWAHPSEEFGNPFKMNNSDKRKCFNDMSELFDAKFMEPVAAHYRNVLDNLQTIDVQQVVLKNDLKNVSVRLNELELDDIITTLNITQQEIREGFGKLQDGQRDLREDLNKLVETVVKLILHMRRMCRAIIGFIGLLCLVLCLVLCPEIWRSSKVEPFPDEGCPNEVDQKLHFRTRFESQGDGHLREWLFDDISISLYDKKTSALLLLADEGYGLTFISEQIICSNKSTKTAFQLRKQLLAYHICKFNYLETQLSQNLIGNFMTMMRRQLPKYNQYMDNNREDISRSLERCRSDAFTCFKDIIQTPLSFIGDHDQMIIVIDALDECGNCPHSVLRLIQRILTDDYLKLPNWVKFVMTSKSHTVVTDDLNHPQIKHTELKDHDRRHIKLLERYVMTNIGFTISRRCLNQIVNAADGSFLCLKDDLKHLLDNCKYRNKERHTPCLDRKYTVMVKRSFDLDSEFTRTRPLLEVLAASFNPIDKSVYYDIARKLDIDVDYELPVVLRKMDYFISITSRRKVVFRHKHMKDWFTSTKRQGRLYYLCEGNGHRAIAQYFLKRSLTNFQSEIKPVDLARHVILSADRNLVSEFKLLYKDILQRDYNVQWEEILKGQFHRANSEALITLLLLHSESVSLDRLAFNASVSNEPTVLYTLLQLGANASYTSELPEMRVRYMNKTRRLKIKDGSWNMLQIAARYGLIPIIDILMKHDEDLVYLKHEVEGDAFQIAMKYQNETVIRKMLHLNGKLASLDAMFYAANEGFSNAISILLEYNAPNQCVKCNKTIAWLDRDRFYIRDKEKVYSVSQIISNERNRTDFKRAIGSDIWKITCSTPLDVAITFGHFNVFKILIDRRPEQVHCKHYSGYSPILTAARYDRLKMFAYLLDMKGVTDEKCKTFNYFSRNKLLRVICADSTNKRACEQQGVLLPGPVEQGHCLFGTTLQAEISKYSHRVAMLDVYQMSKQDMSTYMYYALCKETSFRTLFDIAGCSQIISYKAIREIRFNDIGICNVEEFMINQTDVKCKASGKETVTILFRKPTLSRIIALTGGRALGRSSRRRRRIESQYPQTLQLMADHNNVVPGNCFCQKLHDTCGVDSPNATLDVSHIYRWTVEGVTFLKMPRLFVLCQQQHILVQATKENPWRTQVQSFDDGESVEESDEVIQLLELPDM